MYKQWQIEELETHFTLLPSELAWLEERSEPHNKLGQAVQLKLFQYEILSNVVGRRFQSGIHQHVFVS